MHESLWYSLKHESVPVGQEYMVKKILIPIYKKEVAPRFDLALEALIVNLGPEGSDLGEERVVVLPHASAEEMCKLILSEKVDTVICGGIAEEHYQYLLWKKVTVVDSVIGPYDAVLKRFLEGRLKQGEILEQAKEKVF